MSGPQCCENPPTLSSSSGAGSIVEIGGLKAYVNGSTDSNLSVILISDVYGYEAPKLRKLADKTAAAGFYVVVPDFFYGDPYVADAGKPVQVWLKDHSPEKGFNDAKPIIAALRSKGITAIGAAGFCWGAKVVVELAKSEYIQAGVLLHPSLITPADFGEVKAPIAVLGAEFDSISPPELLKECEQVLCTRPEVKSYVKIFPGVPHGWTVRYKDEDEVVVKSAEEAHKNMLEWFTEYVK
ncbi:hypothetical protein K2173_003054 [Erythroxylum novogranatense]|uniref:Dienelactone hydrolase domain-containing protein n=1 Tax=Erythroxylum novogranatense TaxID=1862640 RepID=A0AAV8S890_9ROSI|nr:hypothetical protein K2173_003054 [Erythroxylum novogranatense]